jgi:hypothetical protein
MKNEKYPEYERCKARYHEIQETFSKLLLEHERLFTTMLPNAITYDKDPVLSSPDADPMLTYVTRVDDKHLVERLARCRQSMKDYRELVEAREYELRRSQVLTDRIYVLRIIEGRGVNAIARMLNYSNAQISRLVSEIERKCERF